MRILTILASILLFTAAHPAGADEQLFRLGLNLPGSGRKQEPPGERLANAACSGDLKGVRAALQLGADPNFSTTVLDAIGTPLFLNAVCRSASAVAEGDRSGIARVLLDAGAKPSIMGTLVFRDFSVPMPPLLAAAYTNRPEVVSILLQGGASVKEVDQARGGSVLHWAAEGTCRDCVAVLIRYGADVNERNLMGLMPLTVAAAQGDERMVALLLENGARPFAKEAMGKSAMDVAANDKVRELLGAAQRRVIGTYAAVALSLLFLLGAGILFLARREPSS
jgi:hypothetical protein